MKREIIAGTPDNHERGDGYINVVSQANKIIDVDDLQTMHIKHAQNVRAAAARPLKPIIEVA